MGLNGFILIEREPAPGYYGKKEKIWRQAMDRGLRS